ncbi:aarF domain-containing protein [Emiliania huxleyi CCMP1516]|uniref:ABC1 atypical kinase-like domain-containing protein n=2 Tax=Emiliania huxleyi TaxID=2903 RepID=A0A0D3JXW2_EMIH1|nr:aarF domain-containing protein [Emiliania huxleyi CCMP1516]EOD28347.1 aarF domain-containing protein [Emiliania huxleyi CCMP1516]|eukprot:XP_005780776.1 aarF domain-containing protein [Emiliania huxleyi CCMP1516]
MLPVRHLRLATSLSRRLPAGRLPIALTAGVGAVALITHAAGQRRGAADCSAASVPSRSSTALARKESSGAASGGLWRLTKILLRCLELFAFLCPVAAWCLLQQLPLLGGAFSRERQLSLLVSALARCGPVGIKWGQWASTRYDLFEEDFCEALGTLTNAAPAHGYAHSRAAIEAAFGQPLGSLFDSFDEKPVASGSIGQARHGTQVHLAKLRGGGDVVAVKEGESVATYLTRAGERQVGEWRQDAKGAWYMIEVGETGSEDGIRYAGTANAGDMRSSVALCGMLIWDNYIHADLHPGNRYLLLGDFTPTAPHIVFLDAGLAASFDDRIFGTAQSFFDAVTRTDGPAIGKAILGLAPTQPYAREGGREAFISEVAAKCTAQKEEMDRGEGRPGDNIRAYMDSVRSHRVVLDPTVMVALMSMLVLEGWQYRLDPAVSIFHCLEAATGGGVFGTLQKASALYQSVVGRLTGEKAAA